MQPIKRLKQSVNLKDNLSDLDAISTLNSAVDSPNAPNASNDLILRTSSSNLNSTNNSDTFKDLNHASSLNMNELLNTTSRTQGKDKAKDNNDSDPLQKE